jgi:hypothetical protein
MESGRVADGAGSAWWSEVNGLMLLDMAEAAAMASDGDVGHSDPVRAWMAYWSNHAKGAATRLCWEAHQCSLEASVRVAEGAVVLEPTAERDFIAIALSSVEIAARANLPLGRGGAQVVGGFCRAFYPGSYPADEGAGAAGQLLLKRATSGRHPGIRIATGVIRGRVHR